jgi:hypothetical protein
MLESFSSMMEEWKEQQVRDERDEVQKLEYITHRSLKAHPMAIKMYTFFSEALKRPDEVVEVLTPILFGRLLIGLKRDMLFRYFRYLLLRCLRETSPYIYPSESMTAALHQINNFRYHCSNCQEIICLQDLFFLIQYLQAGDVVQLLSDSMCTQQFILDVFHLLRVPPQKIPYVEGLSSSTMPGENLE